MTSEPTWSTDDEHVPDNLPDPTPASTIESPTVSPSWLSAPAEEKIESTAAAAAVVTPELEATGGATNTYDVDVGHPGRYELWTRVRVEQHSSTPVWTAGTVSVSVDDARSYSLRIAEGDWTWRPVPAGPLAVRPAEFSLSDGSHSLSIATHRDTVVSELRLLDATSGDEHDGSAAVSDRPFVITDP